MNEPLHIAPGTLELFVMGALSQEESRSILEQASTSPELRQEIDRLEQDLESLAWRGSVEPPKHIRAQILESVRSIPQFPSLLQGSTAADFAPWLLDLTLPALHEFENMHIAELDFEGTIPTGLVWVKSYVDEEVHTDVLESFIILEGTCEVLMEGRVMSMGPGDVIHIPLHTAHSLRITSNVPCKAIVQRVPVAR